ncbi:YceI family protein [Streptomyces aculeolatus]
MTTQSVQIPGYTVGTWSIDPVHSDVSFVVRHLGVSNVRGRFDSFAGEIVTAADPLQSSVRVTIDATSVNTNNDQRDGQVRSADFLDVATHPSLTFVSTGVRADGESFLVDGDLTVRGVTHAVTLTLEPSGFGKGFDGARIAGFSAATAISRKEFGIAQGPTGMAVGDNIRIQLEVEAVQQG